ncbi:MAG: MBL fold metallo-hydrolase [Burkholderiaceae bacterium]
MMITIRRIRAFSIVMALMMPAVAHAQSSGGTDGDLSTCSSKTILSKFIEFGKSGKMPPDLGKWLRDPEGQYIEPYQAFDNVHYVGVCWVSAWIVKTSDGPVLIDTLHDPFVDQLVKNIRQVGVDPADIKLVLMTHGHFDHAGGAYKLKPLMPQAKFVMSKQGWYEAFEDVAKKKGGRRAWQFLDKIDTVAKDGEVFQIGDTAFTAYETPGHTLGTASYGFTVRDGDKSYNAFTVGGLGLNAIKNSAQVEAYIGSVNKISILAKAEKAPIEVHLTTHGFSTGLTEAARTLPTRKAGEPHPLVDQKAFLAQLNGLGKRAEQRLVIEKKKEAGQ